MLAHGSSIAGEPQIIRGPGLSIEEHRIAGLFVAAAWPHTLEAYIETADRATGLRIAPRPGDVVATDDLVAMTIAFGRWLVEVADGGLGETLRTAVAPATGTVTDLSHARTAFRITGTQACEVARKLAPVDFDRPRHGPGHVIQTGSHHSVDLTLYRRAADDFVVYVERSYGWAFWHTLAAESVEFGAVFV